jgi:hypothetical protein
LAKCPPLEAHLYLQPVGGGLTLVLLDTTWETAMGLTKAFVPVVLTPGDTLRLVFSGFPYCQSWNTVWRNGNVVHQSNQSVGYVMLSITEPGDYIAESWDEGRSHAQFKVLPYCGPDGPVRLSLYTILQGSVDDGEMQSGLCLICPNWTPVSEPYTVLGFTHVSYGTEVVYAESWPFQLFIDHPMIDWVLVELRDSFQPSNIVATRSGILRGDGRVLDPTTFTDLVLAAPVGNYYVAVRHRNHLGAMTATPISLTATPTTVDFRDPALPTWGTNARVIAGNEAWLRMGNVHRATGTQQVKYTGANNDRDPILMRIGGSMPTATTAGYFVEDVNLDGVVKYIGTDNDRDLILQSIGGTVPTAVVTEQIPY